MKQMYEDDNELDEIKLDNRNLEIAALKQENEKLRETKRKLIVGIVDLKDSCSMLLGIQIHRIEAKINKIVEGILNE